VSDARAAPFPRWWWTGPLPWAVVLATIPAALAVAELGRLHPDEVYQFLEPAFARAHGYGVLAWEWHQGLRNWAAPLLLSLGIRLGALVGITDPWWVRGLLAVPLAGLQLAGLVAATRLGARRAGPWGGWAALLGLGLLPVSWVISGRTLGEPLSAALLVLAAEALSRGDVRARSGLWGGAALGLAFVARYGSLPAVGVAALWLVVRRQWRILVWAGLGLGLVLLGLGVLDWVTWGRPWHSVLEWFRFNVLTDGAAQMFGTEPAGYYWPFLWTETPLWVWPALVLGVIFLRPRVGIAGTMAAALFLALLRTPHKEERFLYPVLILLVLEAAPGLGALLERVPKLAPRITLTLAALTATLLAAPPTVDLRGDQFRALVKSTRPPEATGLLIVNEGLWGAGGFFYIGKRIPWLTCDFPTDRNFVVGVRDRRFNRAITFEGRAVAELQAAGFRVIGQEGRETLLARP
jgi:phosphatidylinositol glycan class B